VEDTLSRRAVLGELHLDADVAVLNKELVTNSVLLGGSTAPGGRREHGSDC
jgi:hypothetical protein